FPYRRCNASNSLPARVIRPSAPTRAPGSAVSRYGDAWTGSFPFVVTGWATPGRAVTGILVSRRVGMPYSSVRDLPTVSPTAEHRPSAATRAGWRVEIAPTTIIRQPPHLSQPL